MLREKEKKETSAPAEGSWGCERCSEMALTGLAAALAPWHLHSTAATTQVPE